MQYITSLLMESVRAFPDFAWSYYRAETRARRSRTFDAENKENRSPENTSISGVLQNASWVENTMVHEFAVVRALMYTALREMVDISHADTIPRADTLECHEVMPVFALQTSRPHYRRSAYYPAVRLVFEAYLRWRETDSPARTLGVRNLALMRLARFAEKQSSLLEAVRAPGFETALYTASMEAMKSLASVIFQPQESVPGMTYFLTNEDFLAPVVLLAEKLGCSIGSVFKDDHQALAMWLPSFVLMFRDAEETVTQLMLHSLSRYMGERDELVRCVGAFSRFVAHNFIVHSCWSTFDRFIREGHEAHELAKRPLDRPAAYVASMQETTRIRLARICPGHALLSC